MEQIPDDHHHVVEIDSLASELRKDLETAAATLTAARQRGGAPAPCVVVDRVAEVTRNVDQGEYDPQYVSVGPYHRNTHLARDGDKVLALRSVLAAAADFTGAAPLELEDYLVELHRLEDRARSCYSQWLDMPSKDFVRMLLLDGCYILSRFVLAGDGCRRTDAAVAADVIVPGRSRVVPDEEEAAGGGDQLEDAMVVRDVFFLAENQIPFFVVKKIHELAFLDSNTRALDAISTYAHKLLQAQRYSEATPYMAVELPAPAPGNLLHLLHMHFTPNAPMPSVRGDGKRVPVGRWRTATEYRFVGVTIKKRDLDVTKGARCILDVKVGSGGGTLEIPTLNVDGNMWPLLRNLMAFEQQNPAVAGSHVTAYCIFMSQIACTAHDVHLLSKRGVIVHGLGNDDEVAKHLSNLCKGVVFDADSACGNYLRPACRMLERRFQSRPRRWMSWLARKYFSNPWIAAGLVVAAVGLVCTVVQAVYSVLSYNISAK